MRYIKPVLATAKSLVKVAVTSSAVTAIRQANRDWRDGRLARLERER